jgi:para-aminobenzoate synthetase/4-amino-4-deoxychorismate lyase
VEIPFVLLDDATPGRERLLRFARPGAVISVSDPSEVGAALGQVEAALAAGRHVAGWMSYELGYGFEARLSKQQWTARRVPLLWFGVFDAPVQVKPAELAPAGRAYAGPLRHEWDAASYGERFARVHDFIAAGDIYQANLSFRSRFAFAGDPLALYLRLRGRAAAAHGAYIDDGARQILSLSPELFFAIDTDGRITARPMKGTGARGADELSDARARTALANSPKDRAENLMIVDLLRNDLGRLALIGSVAVPEMFAVETYPTLHTMVSTVTAQLKPATRAERILRALFPCGSVTGAPKIRAMEIIREVEQSPRGVYCGAIGYFAPDGSASFNVAIRTIAIRGGEGELGIGGAVVQDSTAEAEFAECVLKARYFDSVRRPIELIETMLFDSGFVRLEHHLDRMQRSAEALALPFDCTSATRTLDAAVQRARGLLRVRLTLDEAGAFSCAASVLDDALASWSYEISPHRVSSTDQLLRHKSSWREFYDDELVRLAALTGCDEAIFMNERDELAEGSRTNLFVRRGGVLVTPPLDTGVLDGVLRRELIETGKCHEGVLTVDDLRGEVFLGNSLRGLIAAHPVHASARARGR